MAKHYPGINLSRLSFGESSSDGESSSFGVDGGGKAVLLAL